MPQGNALTDYLKGAFTPGCSEKHLPTYIKNISALKEKGVDVIAVIAFNDAHVMAAWGKANNIKGDDILFLSDPKCKFSQSHGWTNDDRLARYAFIIDNGTVTYAAKDNPGEVIVSILSDFLMTHFPEHQPIEPRSSDPLSPHYCGVLRGLFSSLHRGVSFLDSSLVELPMHHPELRVHTLANCRARSFLGIRCRGYSGKALESI